ADGSARDPDGGSLVGRGNDGGADAPSARIRKHHPERLRLGFRGGVSGVPAVAQSPSPFTAFQTSRHRLSGLELRGRCPQSRSLLLGFPRPVAIRAYSFLRSVQSL